MSNSIIFPAQIGRASFALRYILCLGAVFFGAVLLGGSLDMVRKGAAIVVLLLSWVVLLFALYYFFRHVVVARLRDAGVHGLWALLILVPFVNLLFVLVLLFVPTNGFIRS